MGVIATTAAPGRRSLPRLFTVASAAVESVWARPALWLFGAAAFMLRGGIFVLLIPLVVVPTPVEIRLMLGGNLSSSGFSPELMIGILAFAILMTLLLMLVLYGLSWLEVWSFQRVAPGPLKAAASERKAVSRVFSVQAGGLSALALAAIPLAIGAINVAYQELVAPAGTGPLYDRIIAGVEGPLLLLVAAIVVVEAVSAVFTRRALAKEFGMEPQAARRRWRLVVAGLGWLVTLATLLPSLWALNLAAQWVKPALAGFQAPDLGTVLIAVTGLAIVWAVAVVLTGFSSALRGALWTVQELRPAMADTLARDSEHSTEASL
jgi:hypothetical protein